MNNSVKSHVKAYFEILRKSRLFDHIADENLSGLLTCLDAKIKSYKKNQEIFCEGERAAHIGVMLDGAAQIVRIDYYGTRSIVAKIEPTELFGESLACAEVGSIPVSVIAADNCTVMLIDSKRIFHPCGSACAFHSQIIFNLMKVIATKNLLLNQKIEITSRRTTREKLTAYLLQQAKQFNSNSFTIPFDRQELADFLGVDRSGLSAEISKLRKEGVIECRQSHFRLTERISDSTMEFPFLRL